MDMDNQNENAEQAWLPPAAAGIAVLGTYLMGWNAGVGVVLLAAAFVIVIYDAAKATYRLAASYGEDTTDENEAGTSGEPATATETLCRTETNTPTSAESATPERRTA